MGVVIGFILGYWFGIANGPLDFKEIREAWAEIKQSQETQALVAGSVQIGRQVLRQGATQLLNEAMNKR